MPNVSHNLDSRFEGEIDADIIDYQIETVSDNGWASVESEYAHHLIAWVPFEVGGQVKTTTYNQNRKERVQSYVQEDGGVNIGTEEWAGERILLLVLKETLGE
jgi:hypothetical protein